MFALAILFGIYSYVIFALGIVGLLDKALVLIATTVFIIGSIIYFRKFKEDLPRFKIKGREFNTLLILFGFLAGVNLIGALAPELSFDALWYHLTIPKIFIENHRIFFIEGNVFYYSLMPKLGEMLYTPLLMFGNETLAKLTQWFFGILTSIVVYKISRKYYGEKISFFAVLVFYGSLVVSWESTVAYVDLIRAFFEAMGLWGFLNWYETRDRKWIIESAVMIGFAISTKLLGFGTLGIFVILFLIAEKNKFIAIKNAMYFSIIAVLTAAPWFVFSYLNSGNPIYPFFDKRITYDTSTGLNLLTIPSDIVNIFLRAADPISPIYIIFLPLAIIYFKRFNFPIKLIAVYSLLALIIWLITPRTGGGRFLLPYLPVFSVLVIAVISEFKNFKLKKYSYALIIFVFIITILYRGIANARYVPVILGIEKKDEFLSKNLNYNFGDFYDTDGYFKNITKNDRALLYGFHNMYYVDFPFIHESYVKTGDEFNYIVTQKTNLPERFSDWNLVYVNSKTGVKVYQLGGMKWHY